MEAPHIARWRKISEDINASSGYHILTIGHQVKKSLGDRNWYSRASIQRTTFHECFFSLHLGWKAIFSAELKCWLWETPPDDNGASVDSLDTDVTTEYHDLPKYLQTPHGNIIQVGFDSICVPEYIHTLNPLTSVKSDYKEGFAEGRYVYGGLFILPPDYSLKLHVNSIRFAQDAK